MGFGVVVLPLVDATLFELGLFNSKLLLREAARLIEDVPVDRNVPAVVNLAEVVRLIKAIKAQGNARGNLCRLIHVLHDEVSLTHRCGRHRLLMRVPAILGRWCSKKVSKSARRPTSTSPRD